MSELKLNTHQLRSKTATKSASRDKNVSLLDREIFATNPMGLKEKKTFYELLGILLTSGLSILDAFEVVADQNRKKKITEIVQTIIKSLQDGLPLSESLARQPKYFDAFEIQTIKMGEKSGKLREILSEMARYYEGRLKIRRKLIQVMSYPVVVIGMAVVVVYFMIVKVVPMFEDVFKQFDAELPLLTQKILSLSTFLQEYGIWMLLGGVVLGITISQIKNQLLFRKIASRIIMKIPVFGRLLLKIQLARFSLTMGTLLNAKVNLDEALEMVGKIITFYPIQSVIPKIKKQVVEGETFFQSIKPISVFPVLLKQMVKVGEKTATLDEMFLNLGKSLEQESEAEIGNLTNILEPVLVIFLGLIVGIILISMYLPMFQLSQAISI
ncbi:MAG: type II secretion system F family protein [Bacteroidia bacterium]